MRIASILGLLAVLAAVSASAKQETVEQLKARAESAKPPQQVKLFLQLAERRFDAADASYKQGDADSGKAVVDEVVSYCERAASAANSTGKHLKDAEIRIRDLQRKVDGLRQSVGYDERPPLRAAVDRLEKIRSDLLATMFRKKS
jgi:hypothetical protein